MIPDKIYIPLYPNHSLDGIHLGDDWMYEPHKECDNVTYIYKDAIKVEIERKRDFSKKMVNNAINSNVRNFYSGELDICNELLKFVESL